MKLYILPLSSYYDYIYETIYSVISRKVQNIIFDALAKKAKDYMGLHVWSEDQTEDIAP